jgi:hypothetical protein
MRKLLTFLIALAAIVFAAGSPIEAGCIIGGGIICGSSTPSYTGPQDAFVAAGGSGGASYFYSCAFAYNAAYASSGGNACIVYGATTASSCTFVFASNGSPVLNGTNCPGSTSVTTFCTVSNTGCLIQQMYDQTGNGLHISQSTAVDRPSLNLAAGPNGNVPCLQINSGSSSIRLINAAGATIPQTFSISSVLDMVSGVAAFSYIVTSSNNYGLYQGTSTNQVRPYFGTNTAATAAFNAYHAVQVTAAGASSDVYVDGTHTSISPGTNSMSGVIEIVGAASTNGIECEVGIWPASFGTGGSAIQIGMNANQHSRYGF